MTTGDEQRRIGVPLMIGLIAIPLVFGWFLLRPGYANSTRIVVLVYAMMGVAFAFFGGLGSSGTM
ncbi:hypothetical protein [Sphingomonas sp.]|uniref:hypothetical protein n=1 Tax=Sphingomonas sp. TaxID=28214 RepID=UPI0025CDED66|nr:hypothetical protein [Sphingomonas sp.]